MNTLNILKHVVIGLAGLALAGWFFAWAARRAPSVLGVKPKRLKAFDAPMSKRIVAERLRAGAERLGYKIEDAAKAGCDLLLSDEPTATSFGFYYPISPVRKNGRRNDGMRRLSRPHRTLLPALPRRLRRLVRLQLLTDLRLEGFGRQHAGTLEGSR